MRFAAIVSALALSACAFSSDAPLFTLDQGAFPFAEGARFDWDEPFPQGERFDVTFHRTEHGYEMIEAAQPDKPMRVMFVPIADTPQEDYVAQVDLRPDETAYAYAFMWRADDVFIIVSDPGTVEPGSKRIQHADAYCTWSQYGECQLSSAENALALYHAAIYPRFVAHDDLPGHYTELVPQALRNSRTTK